MASPEQTTASEAEKKKLPLHVRILMWWLIFWLVFWSGWVIFQWLLHGVELNNYLVGNLLFVFIYGYLLVGIYHLKKWSYFGLIFVLFALFLYKFAIHQPGEPIYLPLAPLLLIIFANIGRPKLYTMLK